MTDIRDMRILLADDDPAQLMLSEAALAGAGFLVETVVDGADAVERFDRIAPDLVVLDVNMPRMSGIEACRRIRQAAAGRALPILMLTGRNDLQAISEAFAAGASDFAQKGINPRLLVERVRFLARDRSLQEELRASRSRLLLAQRIARVGHWELTTDGRTMHASEVLGEILGLDPAQLSGYEDFVRMLDSQDQFAVRQSFLACATGEGRYCHDHTLKTGAGAMVRVHQEAELVQDSEHPHGGTVIVTMQDLTRLHLAEESVRVLSYTDQASGLPNRRRLAEQLSAALADGGAAVATGVVAIRVHHFNQVVHAHGLEHANALLARIGRRIEVELAAVSEGGAVPWRAASPSVCRAADAQLALVLRSRISEAHLGEVAQRIVATLAADPVRDDDGYVPPLGAGLAMAGPEPLGAEQLIERAQVAADQATRPWSCETYSPAPLARSRRRLQVEAALRGAIDRGEMRVVYQPRVAVDDYALRGVECLIRWDNPHSEVVTPSELIAIAEDAGLAEEIGRWMLAESCRQVSAWCHRYEREIALSVNLSARQLHDPQLVEFVQRTLEKHGLAPTALELEVTESNLAQSPAESRQVLDMLRAVGVRITIDDFGAGYSSLGQIRRIPFDCLKLDRSLIADLYTDLGAQGVATAVIAMARSLRVRSAAVGVEDAATLEMLAALGCDEFQGQYVSPPLGPREFEDWLDDGGAAALSRPGIDVVDALEAVERRAFAKSLD